MKQHSKKVLKNKDLLALERGFKPGKSRRAVRVCLVYLNTYEAGMSSLGFQTLYRLMNDLDQVSCERAFYSKNSNIGKSFETSTRLSDFDIIAFSISFENDYINLVPLLQGSGIPLRSSVRNKFHPLMIAGGISCFLNPEPLAPFFDCMLLGEAETFIEKFFNIYNSFESKDEILKSLARNLDCAYIPSFYKVSYKKEHLQSIKPSHDFANHRIKTGYVKNLDKIKTTTCVLTKKTSFKNTFLIETGRGCPHGCRFCSAGFIYRPPRFYSKKNIIDSVNKGKKLTNKIGFVSAAVSDHPHINEICEQTLKNDLLPSFSSFRADLLSQNVLSSLGKSSIKTATIAPEAGSQRMRDVINKNISEQEILDCTNYLVKSGIINIKLYFIIGLPFEEENDIDEIIILIKKIKQVFLAASKKQGKIGTITISINPFIPKPSTPFQWHGFTKDKILKQRMNKIKNSIKAIANVVVKTESIKQAKINAFLSRADQRAADLLENAYKHGWTQTFRDNSTYIESIIYKNWNTDDLLPWDIVDTNLKKSFLKKEYKKAKLEKTSLPCPVKDCNECKLCKK